MYVAKLGSDIVEINESNIDVKPENGKYHLIILNFDNPNKDKVDKVINNNPDTNRFIIKNNIKIYNNILKNTTKKFYVMNNKNDNNIFSFFRKNNKCLLNVCYLNDHIKGFIMSDSIFRDIIKNLEIIQMNREDFENKREIMAYMKWRGNVIIDE